MPRLVKRRNLGCSIGYPIPSGGLTVRRCRDTSSHSFALYRCGQTSIFPQAETCHAASRRVSAEERLSVFQLAVLGRGGALSQLNEKLRQKLTGAMPTIPSMINTSSPITIQPCNAVMFSSLTHRKTPGLNRLRNRTQCPACPKPADRNRASAWPHPGYSITSSARPSSGSGKVMPSALAVLRLVTITAC